MNRWVYVGWPAKSTGTRLHRAADPFLLQTWQLTRAACNPLKIELRDVFHWDTLKGDEMRPDGYRGQVCKRCFPSGEITP